MRRLFLLFLLSLLALPSPAQSTDAALSKRLLNHEFLLRGCWQGSTLWFTADGRPLNDYPELPFSLAGVKIDRIKLQKGALELEGHRLGLKFANGSSRWVPVTLSGKPSPSGADTLHFHIAAAPNGDYTAALDAIFADSPNDLAPRMPSYWRLAAEKLFGLDNKLIPEAQWLHGPDLKTYVPLSAFAGKAPAPETGPGETTQPVLLSGANPEFTLAARQQKFAATVVVRFTVKEDGSVTNPQILQPAGLGLDEAAVAAVLQYKFAPGTVDGKPKAMDLGTQIRFDLHETK